VEGPAVSLPLSRADRIQSGTTEQAAEKLRSLKGTAFRPYVNALQ
jgi:hypothetical protein